MLIRTGKITPFSNMAEEKRVDNNERRSRVPRRVNNERRPNFTASNAFGSQPQSSSQVTLIRKKKIDETIPSSQLSSPPSSPFTTLSSSSTNINNNNQFYKQKVKSQKFIPKRTKPSFTAGSFIRSETNGNLSITNKITKRKISNNNNQDIVMTGTKKRKNTMEDDGNNESFDKRVDDWEKKNPKKKLKKKIDLEDKDEDYDEDFECDDVEFEGGLKLPAELYEKLYDYQQTGVKWLWELYCQEAGGIIADEMGLGQYFYLFIYFKNLITKIKQEKRFNLCVFLQH